MNNNVKMLILTLTMLMFFGLDCKKDNPIIYHPPPFDSSFQLHQPVWSPDGSKILFIGHVFGRLGFDWYEVDSAGGKAHQFMSDTLAKLDPAISPDCTMIAYSAAPIGGLFSRAHVWAMNIDGSNARDLTPFNSYWQNVRWSPDSKYLVFDGPVENSGVIYAQIARANVQTGELTLLTHSPNYGNSDPSYIKDGKHIVYLSGKIEVNFGQKVFFMDADGTNPTPIDTTSSASVGPRPSPTKNELLFYWASGESQEGIYLLDLTTGELPPFNSGFYQPIRSFAGLNTSQWSPDGNFIAFLDGVPFHDLYVVDKYGRNKRALTLGFDVNINANCWSYDNKKIVFQARDYTISTNPDNYIYIYDLEKSSLKKITISR